MEIDAFNEIVDTVRQYAYFFNICISLHKYFNGNYNEIVILEML